MAVAEFADVRLTVQALKNLTKLSFDAGNRLKVNAEVVANPPNLDVALSSRASETTLSNIKSKFDVTKPEINAGVRWSLGELLHLMSMASGIGGIPKLFDFSDGTTQGWEIEYDSSGGNASIYVEEGNGFNGDNRLVIKVPPGATVRVRGPLSPLMSLQLWAYWRFLVACDSGSVQYRYGWSYYTTGKHYWGLSYYTGWYTGHTNWVHRARDLYIGIPGYIAPSIEVKNNDTANTHYVYLCSISVWYIAERYYVKESYNRLWDLTYHGIRFPGHPSWGEAWWVKRYWDAGVTVSAGGSTSTTDYWYITTLSRSDGLILFAANGYVTASGGKGVIELYINGKLKATLEWTENTRTRKHYIVPLPLEDYIPSKDGVDKGTNWRYEVKIVLKETSGSADFKVDDVDVYVLNTRLTPILARDSQWRLMVDLHGYDGTSWVPLKVTSDGKVVAWLG